MVHLSTLWKRRASSRQMAGWQVELLAMVVAFIGRSMVVAFMKRVWPVIKREVRLSASAMVLLSRNSYSPWSFELDI